MSSEDFLPTAIGSSDHDGDEMATINASIPDNPSPSSCELPAKTDRRSSKGWMMVGFVFICNFLVFGFFKSHGMLTKILNREFNATMHVYILMCISYSLNCAAGPLSCYLTRRFSCKSIALVGTSMVTFGLILSWFATSITFLYFSLGMLVGVGSGLTYPTGVILVSSYFSGTKNAGIANAFVVSGSPIGGMIVPFVVSYLSELYTSRGAFLIIGGMMMHAILCARAFRQPESTFDDETDLIVHLPTPPHTSLHSAKEESEDISSSVFDEQNNVKSFLAHSCSTGILTISDKRSKPYRECLTTSSVQQTALDYRANKSIPCPTACSNRSENENDDELADDNVPGLTPRRRGTTNMIYGNKSGLERRSLQYTVALTGTTGSQPYILSLDSGCVILCPSNTDVILKQKNLQFIESAKSIPFDGEGDPEARENSEAPQQQHEENPEKADNKWKFGSILRDPVYVSLLLSNTASAISTINIYLMVSQLVDETDDIDYTKTSLIYLLISSSDLSGRIIGAFLCDKKLISPSVIYAIGLVNAGIFSALLSILTSFVHLCVGTFFYGLSSGFHVGIFGVLLTKIVGIEKIHAGYGITMLINGTVQCIAILSSGRMISMQKDCFSWLLPIFGGVLSGGGLLWTCGWLVFKKKTNGSENQSALEIETNDDLVDDQKGFTDNNNNKVDMRS